MSDTRSLSDHFRDVRSKWMRGVPCGGAIATLVSRLDNTEKELTVLKAQLAGAEARADKWQRIHENTHGSCCQCQRCGLGHDECRCDLDEAVDELEQLKTRLAAAEADIQKKTRALMFINDLLGFHQGDYERANDSPGAHQVVVINADDDKGDYQSMLYACRAAMSAEEEEKDTNNV